eukprot:gnl/TRDRNA2_/TRDRNA2_173404_c1_seq15.p1 gnl/TRDRNA2_/TRDRNA2_173404_c1~~gnl/TRDRNA2_/TRDRNA2_173404_c1_seq15.p1  ORF type:complete len:166 (-),score=32.83 gnl/TRDRNA2_/TRDRNA2_173404_c1_seq15:69-566(-)
MQSVSKLKNQGWQGMWDRFCGENGGGECDPKRHNSEFLRRFLKMVASENTAGKGASGRSADQSDAVDVASGSDLEDADELVEKGSDGEYREEQIEEIDRKELRKAQPEDGVRPVRPSWRATAVAEAWHDFCDAEAPGASHDPSTHDEDFFRTFVSRHLQQANKNR